MFKFNNGLIIFIIEMLLLKIGHKFTMCYIHRQRQHKWMRHLLIGI